MKNLFILLNHTLTEEQIEEAKNKLKVNNIVELSLEQKNMWAQMPPDEKQHKKYVEEIINWLGKNADKGDYILVQGEFGATFTVVDFCLKNGFVPIYAVSERREEEVKHPDGSVEKKLIFKHKCFRKYEYWE